MSAAFSSFRKSYIPERDDIVSVRYVQVQEMAEIQAK